MSARIIKHHEITREQKNKLLLPFLKIYGSDCMSYSTLQGCFDYFIDDDLGFIAYYSFKHPIFARTERRLVLGNPVSNQNDYVSILNSFLSMGGSASFLQITDSFAQVMSNMGFQVNQLGVEPELYLDGFSLRGERRGKLRQWRNKCIREGVKVFEQNIESMNLAEVRELSNTWLKRKGGHELIILTRKLEDFNEADVRYLWAEQNGKLIGLGIFDPIYKDGSIIGYYHNFDRLSEYAPNGTTAYIVLEAIKKFKDEGIGSISLGLAPCYGIDDDYPQNRMTSRALKFMYRYGNFIYPFKGNASHKKKYGGVNKKAYFSSTKGNDMFEVLGAMKAFGVW